MFPTASFLLEDLWTTFTAQGPTVLIHFEENQCIQQLVMKGELSITASKDTSVFGNSHCQATP